MSVHPAIDPVNKSVILFLRPTISKLVDTATDPSVAIASQKSSSTNGQIPESKVPIIEVKEIDSVLRLKDREVAILGGLLETQSSNKQSKMPILEKIPVIKGAFSGTERKDLVTEVIIIIKVTILDSAAPDQADKRTIQYINDPRPIC
jgi:general secretion pathway protein D